MGKTHTHTHTLEYTYSRYKKKEEERWRGQELTEGCGEGGKGVEVIALRT